MVPYISSVMLSRAPRVVASLSIWTAVAIACDDGFVAPIVEPNPDIRQLVIGEAKLALDESGLFRLPRLGHTHEGLPLVDASRAQQLTMAFVRSYGPAFHADWQNDRGGPVPLESLQPSQRVIPIPSPFGVVPEAGCHPAHVRMFGSYYRMTFDVGGTPHLLFATSAQLGDYAVDGAGHLIEPVFTGMDFLSVGIPIDYRKYSPLSPEQAVAITARATGALISTVPGLTRRDVSHSPSEALWEMTLDRPVTVTVTGSAESRSVTRLYVSTDALSRFFVPTSSQPTFVSFQCALADGDASPPSATVTIPVVDSQPLSFVPVRVGRN